MPSAAKAHQNKHGKSRAAASRSAAIWGDGLGLTEKQEHFAQHVADGLNYSAAYRRAYHTDEMAPNTVWREAHRLSRNGRVSARIAQLVSEREEDNRMLAATRTYRVLGQLEELMASGNTDSVRLRAAELLGKIAGLFAAPIEPPRATKTIDELEHELVSLLQRAK